VGALSGGPWPAGRVAARFGGVERRLRRRPPPALPPTRPSAHCSAAPARKSSVFIVIMMVGSSHVMLATKRAVSSVLEGWECSAHAAEPGSRSGAQQWQEVAAGLGRRAPCGTVLQPCALCLAQQPARPRIAPPLTRALMPAAAAGARLREPLPALPQACGALGKRAEGAVVPQQRSVQRERAVLGDAQARVARAARGAVGRFPAERAARAAESGN
jgi:hypothetical protein